MDPMVCGGIYEMEDDRGRKLQATMTAVTTDRSGGKQGTIAFSGYATETVSEDSERYAKFSLIGRPASPKVGRPKKG
jgi:hypothetical protein|tara:strand:+ start:7325 stop:7555 length:231 start_codon:yes stop_codon:yes gene_type:complete